MIKYLRSTVFLCVGICIAAFASQSFAQASRTVSTDDAVDASSRTQIVHALADKMRDHYVFPEVGAKTEKALRKKLRDGGYDSLKYAVGLASALTHDLQKIGRDLHLLVIYGAPPFPSPDDVPTADDEAITLKRLKASNFGVGTVEKLPGNIGYLRMHSFELAKYADQPISEAMTRLADSAALMIDMRQNGGGEPETVALLSSYLFDKRTHLNDLFWRAGERTEQFWTNEGVSGSRFGQRKPVYVLTSKYTFSAAEEFSYNLQSLKRAIVVGDVTGGGAHPGAFFRLNGHFSAFIPSGRAINPITKTNWEGTGVKPDVPVSAQTALLVAQKLAIQALSVDESDPQQLKLLRERLIELDLQLVTPIVPFRK